MKQILILFSLVLIASISRAQTPTYQDCLAAIPICSEVITINYTHSGMGNFSNEIYTAAPGCYSDEANSIWFTWTVVQSGLLRFEIDPSNNNVDHDWTLFDLTNGSCAQLSNSSTYASLMVSSNTWGAFGFNGPTGISTPNGGTGTCNGPGTGNGPKWNADVSVTAGETYVLHIVNWSNNNYGFTLDFSSSTAVLFDSNSPVTTLTGVDLLCNDDCTGEIQAVVNGGYAPYDFNWNNSLPSQANHTGLCADEYIVTVTDSIGCQYIDTIEITEPDPILITVNSTSNISCPGSSDCDGGAQITPSGGTPPYYYLWSSGEITPTASSLCQGINYVTVTDNNTCADTTDVTVGVPDSIKTKGFSDTLICISNPAALAAASTGGTPPFTYVWRRGGLSGPVISTNQAHTVYPETNTHYYVSSTDSRGCIGDTSEVFIKVRPELGLTIPLVDTICPYDTIDITVEGTGGDTNYTFAWSSGNFGPTTTVSPNSPIWYRITVSDACGTPTYVDSVYVQVGGYSPIDVKVRVEDDSLCIGETTHLIASGRGGRKGPKEYIFSWSHPTDGNPIQFVRPDKTTTYEVSISDLCLSTPGSASATVEVGHPDNPPVTAVPNVACASSDVVLSIPKRKEDHHYDWYYGDGGEVLDHESDSIIHKYDKAGCYDVALGVTTDFGCYSLNTFKCAVKILVQPKARFTTVPENPSNINPQVQFNDRSLDAVSWKWYFENDTITGPESFTKIFKDSLDATELKLVVMSEDGCYDTLVHKLDYEYEVTLYYPSSFTPNGDGRNDVFRIEGEAISLEGFDLVIFDRWGSQMFRSTNPEYGWDGSVNGRDIAPLGNYPFILRYLDTDGDIKVIRDHIIISDSGRKVQLK